MNARSARIKFPAIATALLAVSLQAEAADLGAPNYTKAPAYVPSPTYNWTGAYVGANLGGTWTNDDNSGTALIGAPATTLSGPQGILGGIQFGYNYQFQPSWLLGIEGDLSWTSANASSGFAGLGTIGTFTNSQNWYDTLTGRLGYVQNNWLFFVKGGAAWLNADYSLNSFGLVTGSSSINDTRTGWTIGVGAEWMFTQSWSAKLEYDYLDFGTDSLNFGGVGANFDTRVNQFKAGVNYHFLPGTFLGTF
jgi:opacity protein-like surface antigen